MADVNKNILFVTVRTREKTLFLGEGLSVSSKNDKGPFDILPLHANFISLIKEKVRVLKPDRTVQEFPVTGASVLWCTVNKVEVFLGI